MITVAGVGASSYCVVVAGTYHSDDGATTHVEVHVYVSGASPDEGALSVEELNPIVASSLITTPLRPPPM